MANRSDNIDTQYHVWKPEPLTRGTFSILSMSLITMTLFVWTAVHLNIPKHKKPTAQLWRKFGWLLMALLALEYIVLTASCQYVEAMAFGRKMRSAFGQPEPPNFISSCFRRCGCRSKSSSDHASTSHASTIPLYVGANPKLRRYDWTDTHSLYAAMGGFAIDTHHLEQNHLPEEAQRMTLTPEGLEWIAKHDPNLLPDLSETEIQDRSKANSFTKLLTCGQTLWFYIQCLTRWDQGLFVSLLEINTAVHSICALLLYIFLWWNKPLDVEEATLCQNQDIHPIGALMALLYDFPLLWVPDTQHDPLPPLVHLTDEELLHRFNVTPIDLLRRKHMFRRVEEGSERFTDNKIHCFRLGCTAISKYGISRQLLSSYMPSTALEMRIKNRPRSSRSIAIPSMLVEKSIFLASCFYSGCHLVAWNRMFRGPIDELLWKVSCITILVVGFLIPMFWNLEVSVSWRESVVTNCTVWICYSLLILAFGFYAFCRTFIIVECFLDVFHLPDSAFDVPKWSQYFPHIG